MLTEVCAEIKNYFSFKDDKHIGDFEIVGGQITPSIDFPTDYIRIVGSRLNDGVHVRKDGSWNLVDEDQFHGAVWIMSPPAAFLSLAGEIETWQEMYGGAKSSAMGPFQSESFGGYSYSKASGGSSNGGSSAPTWASQYAKRLNIYRKIRVN